MTAIEWTQKVWNPTTGCDRVSPGCDHCYAMTMAKRLKGMGQVKYQRDGDPRTSGPGFGLTVHPDALRLPLTWRKPQRVFVNSMSDLFHEAVPDDFIAEVFAVMSGAPMHTFQILTKRHGRLRSLLSSDEFRAAVARCAGRRFENGDLMHDQVAYRNWPLPNVWLGVSVENQKWADIRIPALLATPAEVRFLSCEPLLGPIDLVDGGTVQGRVHSLPDPPEYDGGEPVCQDHGAENCQRRQPHAGCTFIDWVIVGGESGPDFRQVHPEWVRSIRDQCEAAQVPFFFKQWGGRVPKAGGRTLDGLTWDEYPEAVPA